MNDESLDAHAGSHMTVSSSGSWLIGFLLWCVFHLSKSVWIWNLLAHSIHFACRKPTCRPAARSPFIYCTSWLLSFIPTLPHTHKLLLLETCRDNHRHAKKSLSMNSFSLLATGTQNVEKDKRSKIERRGREGAGKQASAHVQCLYFSGSESICPSGLPPLPTISGHGLFHLPSSITSPQQLVHAGVNLTFSCPCHRQVRASTSVLQIQPNPAGQKRV